MYTVSISFGLVNQIALPHDLFELGVIYGLGDELSHTRLARFVFKNLLCKCS